MNAPDLELDDEHLSAYLDGELSTSDAMAIENRLVSDERLRLRLAELRRASELLDYLPETPHDQRFTRSTLELVVKDLNAVAVESSVPNLAPSVRVRSTSWWEWPRFGYLMAALLVGGIGIGVTVRSLAIIREIRELGLAASMPGLSDVNELSIAESLLKEKTALEVLKMHYGDDLVPSIPASFMERKAWIASMTPAQLDKVNIGRDMLRKLRPDEYKRFSAIETQIESLPNGKELQECIRVIGMMLDNESSYKREDLDGSRDKRLQFLREQLRFSAALAYANHIPESDEKAVETWYEQTLTTALGRDVYERAYREDNAYMVDAHAELITSLLPKLSDTARGLMENLSKGDQMNVIAFWRIRDKRDRETRFIEFYERLNREERDRIDLRDPESRRGGRWRR
jgi:hypothetical protein